jgi:hypothetical protein
MVGFFLLINVMGRHECIGFRHPLVALLLRNVAHLIFDCQQIFL